MILDTMSNNHISTFVFFKSFYVCHLGDLCMSKKRVYELAREVGLESKVVIKKLKDIGIAVASHQCAGSCIGCIATKKVSQQIDQC